MSLSAREENAKTLASVFGLDEDEAWTLLDVRVGVRAATDARSQAVRRHVVAILGRTVSRIEEQDHGAVAIEIVIGPVMPVANAASVRVGITTAEVGRASCRERVCWIV